MGDNLTGRSKDRPECERLSAKDQARECVSEDNSYFTFVSTEADIRIS